MAKAELSQTGFLHKSISHFHTHLATPHQDLPGLVSLCFSFLFPVYITAKSCGLRYDVFESLMPMMSLKGYRSEFPADLHPFTWASNATELSARTIPFFASQCKQIFSIYPGQLNATSRKLSVDSLIESAVSLP